MSVCRTHPADKCSVLLCLWRSAWSLGALSCSLILLVCSKLHGCASRALGAGKSSSCWQELPRVLELDRLGDISLVKGSLNVKIVYCQGTSVIISYFPGTLFFLGGWGGIHFFTVYSIVFFFSFLAKIKVLCCDLFVLDGLNTEDRFKKLCEPTDGYTLVQKVRKPAGCHDRQNVYNMSLKSWVTYSIFSALWQNQLCHAIFDRSLA